MWTRPDGALSSVLSRDIPDPAGTGRLEKSPAGIAARAFFYPATDLVNGTNQIVADTTDNDQGWYIFGLIISLLTAASSMPRSYSRSTERHAAGAVLALRLLLVGGDRIEIAHGRPSVSLVYRHIPRTRAPISTLGPWLAARAALPAGDGFSLLVV